MSNVCVGYVSWKVHIHNFVCYHAVLYIFKKIKNTYVNLNIYISVQFKVK